MAFKTSTLPSSPALVEIKLNNVKDVMDEIVGLIRTTRENMDGFSGSIKTQLNISLQHVGSKLHNIISNVDTITDNLVQSTGSLYQPVIFMLFTCIILLISIVILLFLILKTRREYRKHKTVRSLNENEKKYKYKNQKCIRRITNKLQKNFLRRRNNNNYQNKDIYLSSKHKEHYNSNNFEASTKSVPISSSHSKYAYQPKIISTLGYSNALTLQKKPPTDTMV